MLRRRLAQEESGQGLIVVLLLSMLIMAMVVSTTMLSAANAVQSRRSVDDVTALQLAQSGVQDLIVEVNRHCPQLGSCVWIDAGPERSEVPMAGGAFSWEVLNHGSYVTDGLLRVRSVGLVNLGQENERRAELISDVQAAPDLLDYVYFTRFETQDSSLVTREHAARSIPLTTAVEAWSGVDWTGTIGSGTVLWNGAGSGALSPEICDRHWYDDETGPGRWSMRVAAGLADPAYAGVDWEEQGTLLGSSIERSAACEVSFSSNSELFGKVYSEDALLISSSTVSGEGPHFTDTVETQWDAGDSPAADASRLFRTFPQLVDSQPALGSMWPSVAAAELSLPVWDEAAARIAASCVYQGPTRMRFEGGEVVVTSPLTPADAEDPCFASQVPAGTQVPQIDGGNSVFEARMSYAGLTLMVEGASAEDVPGGAAELMAPQGGDRHREDSLFFAESEVAANSMSSWLRIGDPGGSLAVGAAPLWDAGAELSPDEVLALVSASAVTSSLEESFATALAAAGVVPVEELPAPSAAGGGPVLAYSVVVEETDRTTTPSGTVSAPTPSADPLLQLTTVSGSVTRTVSEETVTVRVEQFTADAGDWMRQDVAEAEGVQQRILDQSGIARVTAAFPLSSDRSVYGTADGTAYVEGVIDGSVSIVAADDIVATGDLTHASAVYGEEAGVPTFRSEDALLLTARRDVLLYHPVRCASGDEATIALTTPRFCPDDVTGLYRGGIPAGVFSVSHPSMQYVNLTTPPTRIDGAIFALQGSFSAMNYQKGASLGGLRINGGVYQVHRGATGVEWEIRSIDADRPFSGYRLRFVHDADLGEKRYPWLPSTELGISGRIWNVTGQSWVSG